MIHPSIHSDTLFEILREEMGLRICCCVDSPTSPDAARNAGCCLFPRGLILNLLLIGYYTSPKKSNWSIPYHSLPFERNTWEQWRALTKTLQVSIIYVLQQFNLLNNSENYMPFHFHWIIIISHHFPIILLSSYELCHKLGVPKNAHFQTSVSGLTSSIRCLDGASLPTPICQGLC